jgi:DNA-binding response OmpR family regulator
MARHLLVVAGPRLAGALSSALGRAGFDVRIASDGPSALRIARATAPDLILLDATSSGLDDVALARRLHARGDAPILLLADQVDQSSRIASAAGADAHATGPFTARELVARVDAQLRRVAALRRAPGRSGLTRMRETIAVGRLIVDPARRTATLAGQRLALRRREFDLLAYLALHPGVALSRERILREVWVWSDELERRSRTVDVHIQRLRQRLETDPDHPRLLLTIRGLGYLLSPSAA